MRPRVRKKSRSVEAGVKWQMFGERLTLSGAVFQDTRRNTNVEVLPNEYEQVGQTRVRGLEAGVSPGPSRRPGTSMVFLSSWTTS